MQKIIKQNWKIKGLQNVTRDEFCLGNLSNAFVAKDEMKKTLLNGVVY